MADQKQFIIVDTETLKSLVSEAVTETIRFEIPQAFKAATQKEYLNSKEVRELTGYSTRALQHLRDSGQIGYIQNGNRIRYHRLEIESFMKKHRILPRENKKGV